MASKTSMAELNRPLSKLDIFYPGSIKNLAERERKRSITNKSVVEEEHAEVPNRSELFLSHIGLPTGKIYGYFLIMFKFNNL